MPVWFWLVPTASVMALGAAYYFFAAMMKESEGTETMARIALHVRNGALAYLKQQYKVVGIVLASLTALFCVLAYGLHVQNPWVPFAFLTGGLFSGLAGFIGMRTATYASARTANAARHSLNAGLNVAFRSGAVMGLTVVGLGLLDISIWFFVLTQFYDIEQSQHVVVITTTMLTFGMGAAVQSLFARVGGGIFTKAADVGADLVGKIEAGIPEDDPRNPATIADNVGDNVGDVAGMGADLYESYVGVILASAALGAAAYYSSDTGTQVLAVIAPMVIGALGALLSIVGVFFVRTKEGASQKDLLGSLARGVNGAAVLIAALSLGLLAWMGMPNLWGLWLALVVGLLTGIAIGQAAEYFTSESYRPTRTIAGASKTGPATVIIAGVGSGMLSVAVPVIAVVLGTTLAYFFGSGFEYSTSTMNLGLYGIGMAAVGMLSTLGITLATDAYGPIADNAGGNAEMAGLPPEVRQRTDALDSLGNTTAATGKGFAIGSAALTGMALLASYIEEVKIGISHILDRGVDYVFPDGSSLAAGAIDQLQSLNLMDMMSRFEVVLINPKVIVSMFIGAMLAFAFSGITMNAVGRAAGQMVDEVRRQFREIPGIMSGETDPDYARCVSISTKAAQKEMMLPAILALAAPVLVGLIFGVPGVLGLLIGAMVTGFSLSMFMANAGGAWDNAKKYIEQGNHGGKGSEAHKAAVIGDTVGDPFKDTSGPGLNILVKLMSMESIVIAGVTVAVHLL
ncbi:sodium-translocating pyrophosphatase [Demequina capsici]|uniref:Putative K(+)-stimulated pyrophosphate-energized sodium pump n=1 Tax=Demequina capsici TaxID=3075620 RepID=A0AA96JET5_9MICO|nr:MULTISPECIES: sodium-translocating pyrophosphatase [unclassified Demequina]WNM23205.1 sodium-translocating pyrophosphatase [Demequina sp. OYTSA14]WNM26084.1 sodium-translocating pyrophosphatase [Demequina sp. PMTSA13]